MEQLAQWDFLRGLGTGQSATTRGTLHAIPDPDGWFPALTQGDGLVRGTLHEAGSVDLDVIDAFEGPAYRRKAIEVDGTGRGAAIIHAYVWQVPLPTGAVPIEHGDFARWIGENRYAVFQPS